MCESYFSMKKSYQKSLLKRRNGSFGDTVFQLIATLGDCGLLTLVCTNFFFVLPNSADFPPSPERLTSHIKAVVQILTISCKKPFECTYFHFHKQYISIEAESKNYRLAVFR